ncbi:hypothetical protein ACUN29_41735 (plasmid) [Streptomyces sp. WC2508]|uniref:hypothetical protein n=1 Tax=Streptomyces sp. WC2508 TaxID=3461405 RepID=UPI004044668A
MTARHLRAALLLAAIPLTAATAAAALKAGHWKLHADRHRIHLTPHPRRSCPDCHGKGGWWTGDAFPELEACGCWSDRREFRMRLLPGPGLGRAALLNDPPRPCGRGRAPGGLAETTQPSRRPRAARPCAHCSPSITTPLKRLNEKGRNMLRIISTSRLAELENLAGAFPFVRDKSDGLEKDLEAERLRSQALERELGQAKAQFQQEQAATAHTYEERLTGAGRSARLTDKLLSEAQERGNRIERVADQKVRELTAQVEQLKAKIPHPAPVPEGIVARYENLVRAQIDLTLFATEVSTPRYGSKVVDLLLVSLCSGCGYRQEETRESVYDNPENRNSFLADPYDGGKLKRWAQEHAEKCRAVALPLQRTA